MPIFVSSFRSLRFTMFVKSALLATAAFSSSALAGE
jgi:hypothetical protein